MTVKKNALVPQPAPFSFPKALLAPPPTQVQQYGDAVSLRIRELEAAASKLAGGFGIGFSPGMLLDEAQEQDNTTDLALMFIKSMMSKQRVSLEKVGGAWGLIYSYEPGIVKIAGDRPHSGPLRDAPLDVREKFLRRSEEFFRRYLSTCGGRLDSMKAAVDAGDTTLELLRSIKLV